MSDEKTKKDEKQQLSKEISTIDNQMKELRAELNDSTSVRKITITQLNESNKAKSNVKLKINDLQSQLKEIKKQRGKYYLSNLNSFMSKVFDLKVSIEKANNSFKLQSNKLDEFTSKINSLQKDINSLIIDSEELKKKSLQFQSKLSYLKTKRVKIHDQVSKLKDRKKELIARMSSINSNIETEITRCISLIYNAKVSKHRIRVKTVIFNPKKKDYAYSYNDYYREEHLDKKNVPKSETVYWYKIREGSYESDKKMSSKKKHNLNVLYDQYLDSIKIQ